VIRYLHRLSSVLFYLLGGSLFASYLLMRNGILLPWSKWWLKVADLPLVLVALLFGGLSVYLSVRRQKGVSWPLLLSIALPLVALFVFLFLLNFWEISGLSKQFGN